MQNMTKIEATKILTGPIFWKSRICEELVLLTEITKMKGEMLKYKLPILEGHQNLWTLQKSSDYWMHIFILCWCSCFGIYRLDQVVAQKEWKMIGKNATAFVTMPVLFTVIVALMQMLMSKINKKWIIWASNVPIWSNMETFICEINVLMIGKTLKFHDTRAPSNYTQYEFIRNGVNFTSPVSYYSTNLD